ncbi:tail fiber protein [Burkholderia phage Bm1]
MAVRKMLYPFAQSGNRRVVPDVSTLSQMAYDTGITFDYERPLDVDSQAKNIDREGWNGVLFDITDNIRAEQYQSYADWVAPTGTAGDTGYPIRALVRYNGERYLSKVANNMDVPTNANSWELQLKSSEVISRVPAWYMGQVTTAGDFSAAPYATQNGFWDFPSDAVVGAMANGFGASQAGYLEVRATTGFVIQTFVTRMANMYVRSLNTSGQWTVWRYIASVDASFSSQPADQGGSNTLNDWNVYITQPGVMQVYGNNFAAPNSPPIAAGSSGTLEILFGNARSGIITQICRALSGGVSVCYVRVRNPAGQWSPWANADGNTKVNRTGDRMTGRLTMQGTGGVTSTSLKFQPPGASSNSVQSLRGWFNTGSGQQEITVLNKAGNSSLTSFTDSGVWWTPTRPTWAGGYPWDNANFDPSTKVDAAPGQNLGSWGRVYTLSYHKMQTFWDPNSGYFNVNVDDTFIGGVWQDRNFNPSSLADRYNTLCHRNSGPSRYGPVSNGIAYECDQPQVLTGVGSNTGEATANFIYFSSRYARNQ